ncbi:hypothetical protein KAJ41_00830 [Candidatus Parcubacteria bacterium]|nr:hypothetical protein [Candidatus Parcubacteria bacterium]
MLENITYFLIFDKPLIFYLGILTFLSFFIAALIAILNMKGINKIPFKWHPRFAIFSLLLALLHGLLGILAYL